MMRRSGFRPSDDDIVNICATSTFPAPFLKSSINFSFSSLEELFDLAAFPRSSRCLFLYELPGAGRRRLADISSSQV